MNKIIRKKNLNPTVTLMEVEAPLIARKAQPGQFIILRVDEDGERIPLTVADYDREKGTITIIFQIVGATTEKLNRLNEGEYIRDFVGPLGTPSHLDGLKKVAVVGGGVGLRDRLSRGEETARTRARSALRRRFQKQRPRHFGGGVPRREATFTPSLRTTAVSGARASLRTR